LAEYYRTHPAEARRAGITTVPAPCAPPSPSADGEAVLESEVEIGITAYLALDGWRSLKTDPCSDKRRGKGFGEIGMADRLYIRYGPCARAPLVSDTFMTLISMCEVMWVEMKRPRGGRVSEAQRTWHKIERERGALTLIAGQDFTPTVVGFREWYEKSGLMRRPSRAGDTNAK